jgi:CRISPR-associated endonuclease/helicase Cas3
MNERCYAHSKEGVPQKQWHGLEDHLHDTAMRAEAFASKFDSGRWGWYAGLWHDLGKFCDAFQRKIRASSPDVEAEAPSSKVNHSSAGALRAMRDIPHDDGLPLAFVIAGHHSGLHDLEPHLKRRLSEKEHLEAADRGGATAEWTRVVDIPRFPSFVAEGDIYATEFWIRMLFSTLIDADRLDTERFHSPQRTEERVFGDDLKGFNDALRSHLADLSRTSPDSAVNRVRREVLADCVRSASLPSAVFTLTVPTGGGKTLASMSFALEHALQAGLDRVIVVIPYTSIIEQTASKYKEVFGESSVLEHHSSFDPPLEPSRLWLATENWDAPIIVTTSVQFFESLFSNRTSDARKLHNIARSVVIFDEVQTFPASLLDPILDALRELSTHYGTTVVLGTATQPALRKRAAFPAGLDGVREIVSEPRSHYESLRRVAVRWPNDLESPMAYEELAEQIRHHERVLAVVHLRNDARRLSQMVDDSIHLSALMCAQHRSEVLKDVKQRLRDSDRCRVVATQLVEAGVDVDFPVLYRALAGLDSIAQAAGRCNREGKLPLGEVTVFVPPTDPPAGVLRRAAAITKILLRKHGGSIDLFDPDICDLYFQMLYASSSTDSKAIQTERAKLQFEAVAAKFQMIEDGLQKVIVIPYDELARTAIREIRGTGLNRSLTRRLQRYSVNVREKVVEAMVAAGVAEDLTGTASVIVLKESEMASYYSPRFGLDVAKQARINPEDLIA